MKPHAWRVFIKSETWNIKQFDANFMKEILGILFSHAPIYSYTSAHDTESPLTHTWTGCKLLVQCAKMVEINAPHFWISGAFSRLPLNQILWKFHRQKITVGKDHCEDVRVSLMIMITTIGIGGFWGPWIHKINSHSIMQNLIHNAKLCCSSGRVLYKLYYHFPDLWY
jgi:hypothetical protein